MKLIFTCLTCKEQFERAKQPTYGMNKEKIFCCWLCYHYSYATVKKPDEVERVPVQFVKPDIPANTGLSSYRKLALDNLPNKCNICGFDKHVKLLDVHHIDSDRRNNKLENLEILCVMCHAMITRGVPFPETAKTA